MIWHNLETRVAIGPIQDIIGVVHTLYEYGTAFHHTAG